MTSDDHEMKPEPAVLVLTVGTGDIDRQEETLFRPLMLSMEKGKWDEFVLLPSAVTEKFARKLENRLRDWPIRIDPLPGAGMENDADACFAHFDSVLAELRDAGHSAERIVADFTRGTKAMSAALVLAATRHGIPRLRYIHGERDSRGMVRDSHEEVAELSTDKVTKRRRLDDAGKLMKEGAYAAALKLLQDEDGASLIREEFREEISRLRKLAAFWSAWDRLDYKSAAKLAEKLATDDQEVLGDEILIIRRLAEQPEQDDHDAMADWLRVVVRDLLANGRRRIGHKQYEDALLRGYRVLELIGQFRLFDRGHDSARIEPDDPDVQAFQKALEKKRSLGFGTGRQGRLTAARLVAARFLKHLGDTLGPKLANFDATDKDDVKDEERAKAGDRNDSILIHGFAVADLDTCSLNELYGRLENLLQEDCIDRQDAAPHDYGGFGRVP